MIDNPTKKSQEAMEAKTLAVPPRERSGEGGSTVVVTPILTTGTKIAEIDVDGETSSLYAPAGGGGGLPEGGTAGQVLEKYGDGDGEAYWADKQEVPRGGLAGQVLKNFGNNHYGWGSIPAPTAGVRAYARYKNGDVIQESIPYSDLIVTNIQDEVGNLSTPSALFEYSASDIECLDQGEKANDAYIYAPSGTILLTCPSTAVGATATLHLHAITPSSIEITDSEESVLYYLDIDVERDITVSFDDETHTAEVYLHNLFRHDDFNIDLINLEEYTPITEGCKAAVSLELDISVTSYTGLQSSDVIDITLDSNYLSMYYVIPGYREVILPFAN